MVTTHETKKTYTRRSDDDRVAELNAKIEAIRTRGERKKARANPAVKLAVQAARLMDKAISNATDNAVLRKAREDARVTVSAAVAVEGWTLPQVGASEQQPAAPVKRGRKPRAA